MSHECYTMGSKGFVLFSGKERPSTAIDTMLKGDARDATLMQHFANPARVFTPRDIAELFIGLEDQT